MDVAHIGRFLWAASFFLDFALLITLFFRHRASHFPAFTTLIIFNVARTISLFLILRSGTAAQYFYTFWSLAVVDTAIQFAIGYEVAVSVFRPMGKWARDIRHGFVFWTVISIFSAAALTKLQQVPRDPWFASPILKGSFFSVTFLTEIFVGMVALSSIAGLNWKSHVARIAEGLAIYSFSNILIEAANTVFGFGDAGHVYDTLQCVRKGLYVACVIYWNITLWLDAPPARSMTKNMKDQLSAIQEAVTIRLDILNSEREP
jgi:hypothetical protein